VGNSGWTSSHHLKLTEPITDSFYSDLQEDDIQGVTPPRRAMILFL
jgi:hypothetical protein